MLDAELEDAELTELTEDCELLLWLDTLLLLDDPLDELLEDCEDCPLLTELTELAELEDTELLLTELLLDSSSMYRMRNPRASSLLAGPGNCSEPVWKCSTATWLVSPESITSVSLAS